jgi:titin
VEAPSDLSAESNPSAVSITLSWTDNSSFEEGFLLERSPAGANTWTQIASLGANVTSFVNKASITCGTAYDYRVRAYQGSYYSDYSSIASATTLICAPLDPTDFTATAASQSRINLVWTDTSDDAQYQESGFTIERQVGAGAYSALVTLAGETTNYSNAGLSCGTSYGYRIQAFNAGGVSNWVTASASTNACSTPAVPADFTVQAISQYEVLTTWTDGDDETAYYIERSPDGSTWTQIAALAADSSEYLDSQLTPGTQYYYRVRSANSYSTAPYTYAGPLSATTFTLSLYSPLVH